MAEHIAPILPNPLGLDGRSDFIFNAAPDRMAEHSML
jgi:hypothetical protein